MNFSAGLSLSTDLVLKNWTQSDYKFQQPGNYDFSTVTLSNYKAHTGKSLVGISPIGMELMFSEYILGQYLTLISDVISWVEEEHEIMSDKGFFKQFMSEK